MLRATVWTVGLFGAGTAICRAFPATWTEPLVLLVLGLALLYVSARTARSTRATEPRAVGRAAPAAQPAPKRSQVPAPVAAVTAAPVPAAATASVPVERTA
jgi:hypothetical protein